MGVISRPTENTMIAEKGFESCCSEPATPCLLYLCPECLPALLCCHAQTAEKAGMGSCFLNCLLISFCSFFGTCQVVRVRQKLREELKLPHNGFCLDCLWAYFCGCCMVLEHRATIKANKIDLSSTGKFDLADNLCGAITYQPK